MEKICHGCNQVKPISEFSKEGRTRDGHKSRCKKCLNEYYNKNIYKYIAHKLEHSKKYYRDRVNKIGPHERKKTYIDLTGKIFDKLTVLKINGRDKKGIILWLCRCECGNKKNFYGNNLKRGISKSCGCSYTSYIDLTGRVFGRLTAINIARRDKSKNNIFWLCNCSCGGSKVINGASLRYGITKSCGCLAREMATGSNNRGWNGGKTKNGQGYILILKPGHPNANKRGYIRENIYIMSEYLGRPLTKDERVHHKNGIKDDNRLENLELWLKGHPSGQRIVDLLDGPEKLLINMMD